MPDGAFPPPSPVRRTFLIQAHRRGDIILRVLGPFVVQGAEILAVEAHQEADRTAIRVEAGGLAESAAQHLVERLREMPAVIGVGLGWRVEA